MNLPVQNMKTIPEFVDRHDHMRYNPGTVPILRKNVRKRWNDEHYGFFRKIHLDLYPGPGAIIYAEDLSMDKNILLGFS